MQKIFRAQKSYCACYVLSLATIRSKYYFNFTLNRMRLGRELFDHPSHLYEMYVGNLYTLSSSPPSLNALVAPTSWRDRYHLADTSLVKSGERLTKCSNLVNAPLTSMGDPVKISQRRLVHVQN